MSLLYIFKLANFRRVSPSLKQCLCGFSKKPDTELQIKESIKSEVVPRKKYQVRPNNPTKTELKWRTPWHEQKGHHLTTLRSFYNEDNNTEILKFIQSPIDLRLNTIKKWWLRKKEQREILLQQYLPERQEILGAELAAAHFLVYRGGAVKFHGQDKWIKAVDGNYELPTKHQKNMVLEAIDCTDMNLYYEGLETLRDLKNVQWLSLNGCKNMDDFCLDVVSNIFSHSLLYLDLRNCYNITERGIGALYKMKNLKILYLDDLLKDTKYELTCILLQDVCPELDIKSDVINFEIK